MPTLLRGPQQKVPGALSGDPMTRSAMEPAAAAAAAAVQAVGGEHALFAVAAALPAAACRGVQAMSCHRAAAAELQVQTSCPPWVVTPTCTLPAWRLVAAPSLMRTMVAFDLVRLPLLSSVAGSWAALDRAAAVAPPTAAVGPSPRRTDARELAASASAARCSASLPLPNGAQGRPPVGCLRQDNVAVAALPLPHCHQGAAPRVAAPPAAAAGLAAEVPPATAAVADAPC